MNYIDWLIIAVYGAGLIGISIYLSKNQEDTNDYFLGGRSFSWWPVGLSSMATQLGSISFISAPAFVGFREGGGMIWLTYEFAVPLAMILLITVIFPPLYKSGITSIYEYLEQRFGYGTRALLSLVFQFSRAFAAGITIYAVGLVLNAAFGIPLWINIVVTGVGAVIYDFLGGIKAVIISDVIQMGILFVGIFICAGYAIDLMGGWHIFVENVDTNRLNILEFSNFGIGDGREFGVLPMIMGGFFLYTSYYGCDQSQAQRMLTARDMGQVRKALMFNGMFRFPLVMLYSVMGLIIGTFALTNPEFLNSIPADNPDYMVPVFIVQYLPNGLIGLLVIAILAAAMSSLDSALNSLSAVTLEDFILRGKKESIDKKIQLKYSKLVTLGWGIVCITLAFLAGSIAQTVIEAINKIGSLFYGPIIVTFLMAILTKRTTGTAINIGIISGVFVNMVLWLFFSDQVFWFWWNVTGAAVTFIVADVVSRLTVAGRTSDKIIEIETFEFRIGESVVLIGYFLLIILICASLTFWL